MMSIVALNFDYDNQSNLRLWTLDLVLSNKGTIWQATKIPAQARLALCGGGRSLKHSNPKALLSSAGVPPRSSRKSFFKIYLFMAWVGLVYCPS
jgi:hypothetical protein